MLLETWGHDVRLIHDGLAAMNAALEYIPDLVLLEIGLPVVDGLQVAKWIRQQPALKNVVLVALTGYGQQADRQRSQEAGFHHHPVKPVDFVQLEGILVATALPTPGPERAGS
jgi:CheY-like chemotaxis protein